MVTVLIVFTSVITMMVVFAIGFGAGAQHMVTRQRKTQQEALRPRERRTPLSPPSTPWGDDV